MVQSLYWLMIEIVVEITVLTSIGNFINYIVFIELGLIHGFLFHNSLLFETSHSMIEMYTLVRNMIGN